MPSAARREPPRPTPAGAPVVGRYQLEFLSPAAYRARSEAFADLARRAAESNPHMSPAAIEAASATLVDPEDVAILAVSDRQEDGRLRGVWALAGGRPAWAAGLRVQSSPLLPLYEALSQPVIDRDHLDPVLRHMLGAIAAHPLLPRLIHCPSLPLEGPVGAALAAALPGCGGRMAIVSRWARAIMRPDAARDPESYLRNALGGGFKRRRAQWRALERTGPVAFRLLRGEEAHAALPEFLALEASGWKGASATALACAETHADYARRLVRGFAAQDEVMIARLARAETPLAMGLVLRSAGTALFLKTAYDEAERRHSPGVMLAMALTEALVADPGIALLDSCMDDSGDADAQIWSERRMMGHALIGLGSAPSAWIAAHGLALRQRLRAARSRYARS